MINFENYEKFLRRKEEVLYCEQVWEEYYSVILHSELALSEDQFKEGITEERYDFTKSFGIIFIRQMNDR